MPRGIPYVHAAVLLLLLASHVVAQGTEAQRSPTVMPLPVVAVIDFQRVVKESAAGRSVRGEIDKRHAVFQKEIKKIKDELDAGRETMSSRPAGMADAEFTEKRKKFRARVGELTSLVQRRKRELDNLFNTGMREVDRALAEILKELAQERGINLILNAGRGRGLVLFAEGGIVITDEALRRLNERLPTALLTKPASAK